MVFLSACKGNNCFDVVLLEGCKREQGRRLGLLGSRRGKEGRGEGGGGWGLKEGLDTKQNNVFSMPNASKQRHFDGLIYTYIYKL